MQIIEDDWEGRLARLRSQPNLDERAQEELHQLRLREIRAQADAADHYLDLKERELRKYYEGQDAADRYLDIKERKLRDHYEQVDAECRYEDIALVRYRQVGLEDLAVDEADESEEVDEAFGEADVEEDDRANDDEDDDRESPVSRTPGAKPDTLNVVRVLEAHGVPLSSSEPGQLNHEECPRCFASFRNGNLQGRTLSVRINADGSGAWFCHLCSWSNEPGEVTPNRPRKKPRPQNSWFDKLTPHAQMWFASILEEHYDRIIGELDEHSSSQELVLAVWELVNSEDRRFRKVWNAAAKAFKSELATTGKLPKGHHSGKNWPPKWITKDKRIRDNLGRKGNSRLLDLYWILRQSKWTFARTNLFYDDGTRPVLAQVPYDRIERELGLSRRSVGHHMQAMVEHGLILEAGGHKSGPRGQKLWALGTWNESGFHPNPLFFLRDSREIREALRCIDVSGHIRRYRR